MLADMHLYIIKFVAYRKKEILSLIQLLQ